MWTQSVRQPSRGITSADFDRDGDIDIYVSNYRLEPNLLYVNDGSDYFANLASARGATGGNSHTIGSAWGDLDNDGEIDLFVGNFAHGGNPGPSSCEIPARPAVTAFRTSLIGPSVMRSTRNRTLRRR